MVLKTIGQAILHHKDLLPQTLGKIGAKFYFVVCEEASGIHYFRDHHLSADIVGAFSFQALPFAGNRKCYF